MNSTLGSVVPLAMFYTGTACGAFDKYEVWIGLSLFDLKQLLFDSGNILQCNDDLKSSFKLEMILHCCWDIKCCFDENTFSLS